jgi:hypothetical protein
LFFIVIAAKSASARRAFFPHFAGLSRAAMRSAHCYFIVILLHLLELLKAVKLTQKKALKP